MREWSVTVEWEPSVEVTEDLAAAVAEIGGALSVGSRLDTTLTVASWDPGEAIAQGVKMVTGIIPGDVVAAEVTTTEEADRRLEEPAFPDLVGVTEISKAFGISRQRASALQKSPGFPGPVAVLASGPIWRRGDLSRFEETWRRTPGRPPKPADKRISQTADGTWTTMCPHGVGELDVREFATEVQARQYLAAHDGAIHGTP